MEFCEIFIYENHKCVCLTASFLATGGFKFELFQNACMVYTHAYLNTLLLLHSTFMLSVVKMLLKGEVGGHALNSCGNYIVDHGKSWKNHGIRFFNFCGNPVLATMYVFTLFTITMQFLSVTDSTKPYDDCMEMHSYLVIFILAYSGTSGAFFKNKTCGIEWW